MRKLVTADQMKNWDRLTMEEIGIPSLVLMERASLAVAETVMEYPQKQVLCVCGTGNNGGDGVACARILHTKGVKVHLFLTGNRDRFSEQMQKQMEIAGKYGIPVVNNWEADTYTTIVDAMFGVGLHRPLQGIYAETAEKINRSSARVIAVDLPSGICADSGKILGCAVKADVTVTFAAEKPGLYLYPGAGYTGEIRVADIGVYEPDAERWKTRRFICEDADIRRLMQRPQNGHKGTFGKVWIAAGSKGMCGAAYLCAKACLRSGAGMVKLYTEKDNWPVLQQMLPEVMISAYDQIPDEEEIRRGIEWADVILAGPGLGKSRGAADMLRMILKEKKKKIVLDADALNLLAEHPEWIKELSEQCVLTPHLGEMARLTGRKAAELKNDLITAAESFAEQHRVVCVLKDARTVTAVKGKATYLNLSGSDAMATAGSGDVLSGILASVLAQMKGKDEEREEAVAAGVFLHGRAGERAADVLGNASVNAGDLLTGMSEYLK